MRRPTDGSPRRRPRLPAWVQRHQVVLAVLVSVGIATASLVPATDAAFTASTSAATTFTSGSVTVTDDDAGAAVLSLTGLRPGDSSSSCIRVSYSGTLPASMKLFRIPGGTGLAPYLDLKLTRGTISSSGGFRDCTGFTPDAGDYLGKGAGVVYGSTLDGFPGSVAAGLDDLRTGSVPEVWTGGETHAYKFTVTLKDDVAAQGLTATGGFVWQAVELGGYAAVVLADGPTGYWSLDEAGGTTAVDVTGHGHDGTYTDGPTLHQVSGVKDARTAVTFDGTDDRVHIPYAAALNPAAFTVEAWAKSTGGSGWRTIATSWGSRSEGYGLWAAPGNDWQFWANGTDGETGISGPMTPGAWAHVVGTYDGTTMRIHVDGQLAASYVHTYTPHTTAALELGATSYDSGGSWGEHFTGSVDEVAVYDRVLSDQEIREHYEAGRP